jgi:hypothetical protein
VQRAEQQRSQDQHVERPLEKLDAGILSSLIFF